MLPFYSKCNCLLNYNSIHNHLRNNKLKCQKKILGSVTQAYIIRLAGVTQVVQSLTYRPAAAVSMELRRFAISFIATDGRTDGRGLGPSFAPLMLGQKSLYIQYMLYPLECNEPFFFVMMISLVKFKFLSFTFHRTTKGTQWFVP